MSKPKLHHYVPQCYLRRFANERGLIWVWDRDRDRVFQSQPNSVAAETHFYFVRELLELGHDPLTLESHLSELEGQFSLVSDQWLDWLGECEEGFRLPIPRGNRHVIALYIAVQILRTADQRQLFAGYMEEVLNLPKPTAEEERDNHIALIWDTDLAEKMASRIGKCSWVFIRNTTSTPFVTSDNPVAFRTQDNAMWVRLGHMLNGTYIVFPLSPTILLYCFPRRGRWKAIGRLNNRLMTGHFNDEMARDLNSAQAFMAARFLFSRDKNFDFERAFFKTIGTDVYRRY